MEVNGQLHMPQPYPWYPPDNNIQIKVLEVTEILMDASLHATFCFQIPIMENLFEI
jgi:hypothetical protein